MARRLGYVIQIPGTDGRYCHRRYDTGDTWWVFNVDRANWFPDVPAACAFIRRYLTGKHYRLKLAYQ